jgi:hypothetical protein
MGRPRSWAAEQTGRPPMYSPRRLGVNQREAKVAFCFAVSVDASLNAVSSPILGQQRLCSARAIRTQEPIRTPRLIFSAKRFGHVIQSPDRLARCFSGLRLGSAVRLRNDPTTNRAMVDRPSN